MPGRVPAVLFTVSIIATIGFFLLQASHLRIVTQLGDLAPPSVMGKAELAASTRLTEAVQRRVVLLLSGQPEKVTAASSSLREALAAREFVTVLPDNADLARRLVQGLSDYRFGLLTRAQRQALANQSQTDIARRAYRNLVGFDGTERALDFGRDPLRWYDQYIESLSESLLDDVPEGVGEQAMITLLLPAGSIDTDRLHTMTTALDSDMGAVKKSFQVEVDRSGVFFFTAEAASESRRDISLISAVSLVGVTLLIVLVFRSIWPLMLAQLSILAGVAGAFALTHTVYGSVHVLTIVFGAGMIGVVVDYAIHYFYHRSAGRSAIPGKMKDRSLHRALLLSLVTSVIGYAALSVSDLQALRKVALFSCSGLILAWLSVVVCGRLFPVKAPRPGVITKLAALFERSPRPRQATFLRVIACVLPLAALVIMTTKPPVSDDPRLFFSPSQELLEQEKAVATAVSGIEPGRYITIQGRDSEEVTRAIRKLVEDTAKGLASPLLWIPPATTQLQDYRLQQSLYAKGGAAEQLTEQAGLPLASIEPVRAEYASAAGRTLSPSDLIAASQQAIPPLWFEDEQGIVAFVLIRKLADMATISAAAASNPAATLANTVESATTALALQRESAQWQLLAAYGVIGVLMLAVGVSGQRKCAGPGSSLLQSLRASLSVAIAIITIPLCASSMVIVYCFVTNTPMNLFHFMALFLVLGLGMDYGIFSAEFRSALGSEPAVQIPKEGGGAIRDGSATTREAIILSALTSLLSFGMLSVSSIPVVSSFGMTLLIGNSFNLLGALLFGSNAGGLAAPTPGSMLLPVQAQNR